MKKFWYFVWGPRPEVMERYERLQRHKMGIIDRQWEEWHRKNPNAPSTYTSNPTCVLMGFPD